MHVEDLEVKYPWTSHSLVRLFAEYFSEAEWDVIHAFGLQELIQADYIFDARIIQYLSLIYLRMQPRYMQEMRSAFEAALASNDADAMIVSSQINRVKPELSDASEEFLLLVAIGLHGFKSTEPKIAIRDDKAQDCPPATAINKGILDRYLDLMVYRVGLMEDDLNSGIIKTLPEIASIVVKLTGLLAANEEIMPYLEKKDALKESLKESSGFHMHLIIKHCEGLELNVSPGRLCQLATDHFTFEFFTIFCHSTRSMLIPQNPEEEDYHNFLDGFMKFAHFYDYLTQQLEATHAATIIEDPATLLSQAEPAGVDQYYQNDNSQGEQQRLTASDDHDRPSMPHNDTVVPQIMTPETTTRRSDRHRMFQLGTDASDVNKKARSCCVIM